MHRFLSLAPQARWRENGLECPVLLYCIVCMMLTLSQKPRWPVLKPTDDSGSFSPPNTDWQQQQQEQNQNGGGGDGVSFGADPSDNSNQGSVSYLCKNTMWRIRIGFGSKHVRVAIQVCFAIGLPGKNYLLTMQRRSRYIRD